MNAALDAEEAQPAAGEETLQILHMGPVGGGMAAVVREILASPLAERHSLAFIPTWRGPEPVDRLLVFLRALAGLVRWCLGPGRRLVHIHVAARGSVYRKGICVAVARLLQRPVILQLHVGASEVEEFAETLGPVGARLVRWAFRLPDQVVSVSSAGAEAVHRCFGIDDVVVLPNAVPAAALVEAQAPREASDLVRMLYVGGFRVPEKGGETLLGALPEVLAGNPRIRVALAGPGELPPSAQGLLGGSDVEWLGWLDAEAMHQELRNCDVFVLPSLSEGLPVALLEAMAHGAAIVATTVGAVPATLTGGEEALLVAPGDPAALASSMRRLAQDAALRSRLGTAARARAGALSHDKVYPKLEALYLEVAAR
ncbi:MAG: glycosyltransferase family 4 protein [Actinomycetota bacterium]